MNTRSKLREDVASVSAALWLELLTRHAGNIARASKEAGFTGRQGGHALTRRLGLVEEALRLRAAAGQPATGRPRNTVKAPAKGKAKS